MSSITTVFPSGAVQPWCLSPIFGFSLAPISYCAAANASAEFQTVCCNGDIIDTTGKFQQGAIAPLDVENLLCCVLSGTQDWGNDSGNAFDPTTCNSGSPTPIASLAATNTRNVAPYEIIYTNIPTNLFSSIEITATGTPYCLWLYTASGVVMATVTVPAVQDVASPTSTMNSMASAITTIPTSTSQATTTSPASTSQAITTSPTSTFQASTSATSSTKSSSSQTPLWKSGLILGLLVSCMSLI